MKLTTSKSNQKQNCSLLLNQKREKELKILKKEEKSLINNENDECLICNMEILNEKSTSETIFRIDCSKCNASFHYKCFNQVMSLIKKSIYSNIIKDNKSKKIVFICDICKEINFKYIVKKCRLCNGNSHENSNSSHKKGLFNIKTHYYHIECYCFIKYSYRSIIKTRTSNDKCYICSIESNYNVSINTNNSLSNEFYEYFLINHNKSNQYIFKCNFDGCVNCFHFNCWVYEKSNKDIPSIEIVQHKYGIINRIKYRFINNIASFLKESIYCSLHTMNIFNLNEKEIFHFNNKENLDSLQNIIHSQRNNLNTSQQVESLNKVKSNNKENTLKVEKRENLVNIESFESDNSNNDFLYYLNQSISNINYLLYSNILISNDEHKLKLKEIEDKLIEINKYVQ